MQTLEKTVKEDEIQKTELEEKIELSEEREEEIIGNIPLQKIQTQDKQKFHSFHLEYLKELVAAQKLSIATAKELLEYWKIRLRNAEDSLYQNYFDYYIFFEAANAGLLSAWVVRMSDHFVLHHYGIMKETFPILMEHVKQTKAEQEQKNEFKINEEITINDQTFQIWIRSCVFHKEEYVLIALYPTHLVIDKQLARFTTTFKHFYMPESFHKDKRFFSIFSNQSQTIAEQCNNYLYEKKMVTFTHLQFESYKKDLAYIGESYSQMLLQELRSFLAEKLQMQEEDILLTIDSQRFLIISFDQDYEKIKKAFSRLVIRAKSMVFPYSIKVSTYNEPIDSLASIWSQITQR